MAPSFPHARKPNQSSMPSPTMGPTMMYASPMNGAASSRAALFNALGLAGATGCSLAAASTHRA